MKKLSYTPGFSLIELIVFILVVGIASTSLVSFQAFLQRAPTANYQTIALALAQERMELITSQERIKGYNSFTDPCLATPTLLPCIPISSLYNVTSNISAYTLLGDSNYKLITVTVTVTGKGNLTLQSLVGS